MLIQALSILNKYNDIADELSFYPLVQNTLQGSSMNLQFDHKQKDLSAFSDLRDKVKVKKLCFFLNML